MNTKIISYVISNLFRILMFLFLFPLAISIYYKEGLRISISYIIPIIILCIFSYFLAQEPQEEQSFFLKKGFFIFVYVNLPIHYPA